MLLALASLQSVQADEYGYLVFQTTSGDKVSMAVSNLKMTIADGQLLAVNSLTNETFALSGLNKMYFSYTEETTDGIRQLTDDDATEDVDVYTISGTSLGHYARLSDARALMRNGVYVVKHGNKTYKLSVK